jgi:hypothetical protein
MRLPALASPGDALLFAVSARRQLSWRAFTGALDAVFIADEREGVDVRQARSAIAALGSSLGHWDIVPDGQSARICVAPPVLARLPWPGLPKAVLCGARSPDTLEAVKRAAAIVGVTARAAAQHHLHRYAPARIEVTANSSGPLANLADALGVMYRPEPAAGALTAACGSLSGYLGTLEWSAEPDIDWTRRDFDPEGLRLVNVPVGGQRDGLTLSVYENPANWARQDRLWRGERWALAHRDWARFAVLAERGRRIATYEHRSGTFTVPRQVPIPAIPARALALCSGKPARLSAGQNLGTHSYLDVPESIAAAVLEKLGQDCSVRFGDEGEGKHD